MVKGLRCKKRKLDKSTQVRDIIFFGAAIIALIDIIVCLVTFRKGYIADLLRPFIIILCYRSQQKFFVLVMHNIKDSIAMIVCILVWVLYFALLAQFIFASTSTGITEFSSFGQSYWQMFVCLTFENFPDLMLEATA